MRNWQTIKGTATSRRFCRTENLTILATVGNVAKIVRSSGKYLLAIAFVSWLLSAPATAEGLQQGEAAPDLSQFGLVGDVPSLKGKVTLIDFWASWCAPCKASFPAMEALYQEYKDNGFQIIGLSVDTKVRAMEKFVQRMKPSFSIVHDSEQKLVAASGIEAMPTSYLLDRKGLVRFAHKGWLGKESEAELRGEIETLLEEKADE